MAASYHRLLLLFVDGIGLAPAGRDNPFSEVPTPALSALLRGPLTSESLQEREELLLAALDACLGVDGLPQSATGQTTLFTGVNAARHVGHHVPALPGPRLRALVEERGLLGRLAAAGRRVTFANPFTPGYLAALAEGRARPSATTVAALASGTPLRGLAELAAGTAVTFDVTGDIFARRSGAPVPPLAPETAGRHLAALAGEHDFTLWETFLTDLAGHRRWGLGAEEAIRRLDGLLDGLLVARPADVTVLLTSDHGNLEEAGHRSHTRNPVPLLVVGPAASRFAGLASIADLAGRIEAVLGSGGVNPTRPGTPG